jgi:hypothetical protein
VILAKVKALWRESWFCQKSVLVLMLIQI